MPRLNSNVGVGTELWAESELSEFDELTAWPDEVATVAVVSWSAEVLVVLCSPQPVSAPTAMTVRLRAAASPAWAR